MGKSDPGSVEVRLQKSALTSNEMLSVIIENHRDESIFLPGCNHFLLEEKKGDGWVVTRQKACVWEGNSEEIAGQKSRTFGESIEGMSPGTYRVRVDYSLGCKPGGPLSAGGCREKASATPAEFTVK